MPYNNINYETICYQYNSIYKLFANALRLDPPRPPPPPLRSPPVGGKQGGGGETGGRGGVKSPFDKGDLGG